MIDIVPLTYSHLKRWDYKSAKAAEFRRNHPHFVPFGTYVQNAAKPVDPRKAPDQVWDVYGVTNQVGVYLSGQLKGEEFTQAQKVIENDWFVHNPTRAVVGSLGRVSGVGKFAVTSPEYQVWRLRDGADMTADFVELLIRTPLFLDLIKIHRRGAVKERLFVENLCEIPVPVVSTRDQEDLLKDFRSARKLVAEARKKLARAEKVAGNYLEKSREVPKKSSDKNVGP